MTRRWSLGAVLSWPVVGYRRFISPALPARCRFHPSCSAYAVEALRTHGAVAGLALAGWRLLRCQPFNAGGYDPVPARSDRRFAMRSSSRADRSVTATGSPTELPTKPSAASHIVSPGAAR